MLTKSEREAALVLANSHSSLLKESLQKEIAEIVEESEVLERTIIRQNIQASKSIL